MKCTAYFEENELVTYDKYEKAMNKLSAAECEGISRDVIVRKAYFGTMKDCIDSNGRVMFSIAMKDYKSNEIYLEKKTFENSMIFKSFTKISKKEAEKILKGQIQWMRHSKNSLFKDFYLESEINKLQITSISEIRKDICTKVRELDGVVFKHSIRGTDIDEYNGQFFDYETPMVDIINCDNVLYSYRRYVHIPQAVSNIVNIQSAYKNEVAYSL